MTSTQHTDETQPCTSNADFEFGWVYVIHPPAGTVLLNMEVTRCHKWFPNIDECIADAQQCFNIRLELPDDCHAKVVLQVRPTQIQPESSFNTDYSNPTKSAPECQDDCEMEEADEVSEGEQSYADSCYFSGDDESHDGF